MKLFGRFGFSFLMLMALLMSPVWALAGTAQLTWTPNTEADLAGYKVYQSTTSGVYGAPAIVIGPVTNPPATQTIQLPNLAADTVYFFVVTAYDTANGESGRSNEVSKLIPKAVTSISVSPSALNIVIPVGGTQGTASIVVTNTGNVPVTVTWNDSVSCLQGLVGLTRTIAVGASTTFTINGICAMTGTATLSGTGFTSVVLPVTITQAVANPAPIAPTGLKVQ